MPIVVWAPDFSEHSGGSIVLHALAHKLGILGATVYAGNDLPKRPSASETGQGGPLRWVMDKVRLANHKRLARKRGKARPSAADKRGEVVKHPALPSPSPVYMGQRPFIAIYPEIVSGNPLGAPHVVRWLLHRPGFFKADVRFGVGEYTFFYQPAFAENLLDADPDNLLRIHWLRDDVYFDRHLPNRQGACRMIRKGHADPAMLADDTAILLDGKSHEDIAAIFNQTERFYCHDPYTLYVYYAALCGCTPIIVPQPGLTGADWRAGYELKHGVAYGEDEVEWARATRAQLFADQAAVTQAETAMLQDFLAKLARRFPG